MFEVKEGNNCEECLEITGRFSPSVGPIIRRLQSDTNGHKWLINRRVRREIFLMIYYYSTFVWSECPGLLSVVRAWSSHQAGLSAGSPGHPRCQLPGPAPITISSRNQSTNWPSINRWSARRWDINNNNIGIITAWAGYISLSWCRLSDSNESVLC